MMLGTRLRIMNGAHGLGFSFWARSKEQPNSIRLFQWTSSFWSICQIYAFQVHILSIFGPHFCSWRSPFHSKLGNHLVPILKNLGHHSMWAGVNISLKNQHFLTDPENDPVRDSSSICGSSTSPQLYHCFYCHMLYDGNGQGWGAYWNRLLTPTVAPLYTTRYWSSIVKFGWHIPIRCASSEKDVICLDASSA